MVPHTLSIEQCIYFERKLIGIKQHQGKRLD